MRFLLAASTLLAAAGAILLTALLTRDSSADLDPPGPPVENDWLAFNNLTFVRDAGDGGGTAEICVDVRFTHTGHSLGADAADWLKFDCWDVVMDEGNPVSNGAPLATPYTLIGSGGKVDQWLSAVHRECFPTAPWEFRVRVTEIEGGSASNIVSAVGKAIGQGKDPRAVLAGALLEAVATILNELFEGEENIGTGQQNFAGGEGDPGGEVEKGGSTEYFNYKVKKVVRAEPNVEPNPCQVATPTPTLTPTPSPQPTPTPQLPCEEGNPNYPGCCEDDPAGCCGDEGFPTCGPSPCDPGQPSWPECCPPDDGDCCPTSEPACCDEGGPPPCLEPTSTATPTPTPSPTPCPNDNDCDGVLNNAEIAFGSDPNDDLSTPENFEYDPLTCIDNFDNDADGFTDLQDFGCLHSRAGPAGEDAAESPFGFDAYHPFSRSVQLAASSWVALIAAVRGIEVPSSDDGGATPAAQADLLRRLIGTVGHFAALYEVEEADDRGGFQQPDLDAAYLIIDEADDLVDTAVDEDDTDALVLALVKYRQAFEMFAAGLHPGFNVAARGDMNCDGAIDTLDPLAHLRVAAGLDEFAECMYNGDLNCDSEFDAIDALFGLRHVAGLPLALPEGCPGV